MTRSIAIVLILCAICVGCGGKQKTADVNAPDTIRVCDTVRLVDTMLPAYKQYEYAFVLNGEKINKCRVRVEVSFLLPPDSFLMHWSNGETSTSVMPARWVRNDISDCFPDSLSACLALKSRYEKQAKELEEKMNHLKCEGR